MDPDTVPEVTATASPYAGLAPLAVQFECTATGVNLPCEYRWNFGNGVSSNLRSPSYTYDQPGDYVATCTVTDADGDQASGAAQVQVDADLEPAVEVLADPTAGLAPLAVAFTSRVTGGNPPFSYQWDFGDGGLSDQPDPSHEYTGAGTFQAVLVVTDTDGDTALDSIAISVGDSTTPAVTVAANPEAGPAPLQVTFTCSAVGGNLPYSYHWNFGDGRDSNLQNPTHTYTRIGDYLAACTVTDAFDQTGQGTVIVQAVDPNLPPVIDGLTTDNGWAGTDQSCAAVGQTMVQLRVAAHDGNDPPDVLSYQWTFESVPPGSVAAFNNAGVMNPTFVPDLEGQYVARVWVSDERGGVASAAATVTAGLSGRVMALAPVPAPGGTAGDPYADSLEVRVETQCGIPCQNVPVDWLAVNGRVVWTSGASDDQGLVQAEVELGCDLNGPAEFTALLPDDPDAAVFVIVVNVGPAFELLIAPERGVPVHDDLGNSNPMIVMVTVADRCGNYVSGTDVSFDIHTDPGSGACFADQCPGSLPGGMGVKSLTGRNTASGVATFQLYDDSAEEVDVWVNNVSPALDDSGGFRISELHDFEGLDGGFSPGSTSGDFNGEWQWGEPAAGSYSGKSAWATVLDGDYNPESDEDARFVVRGFNLPCTGGASVYLRFWEYHEIAAGAVAYVSVWDPWGENPPAADGVSAYDAEVDGHWGYQGSSGGWREVTFDLTTWQCQWVLLLWNLYLNQASDTGFGWAVDDVMVEYFDNRAQGQFVAGPLWDGVLWNIVDGVGGCDTSPAGFGLTGFDQWGNQLEYTEVAVITDATGTTDFTGADPGWIVSQAAGGATINAGPTGTTDVWFTDTATEAVNVTMETASGSDPSVAVTFLAPTADEAGFCWDGMDDDCDGLVDCQDDDCAADPACLDESDDLGNCLDSLDNDSDGLQDCEDYDAPVGGTPCRSNAGWTCDNDAGMRVFGMNEPCNNADDLGIGFIDIISCNCTDDNGCDDIDPFFEAMFGVPYRCYTELETTGFQPVCTAPCFVWAPDFCIDLSGGALLQCDFGTGACLP